jgi:hypothetical protein
MNEVFRSILVLIGTIFPPALWIATAATIHSMELGAHIATES